MKKFASLALLATLITFSVAPAAVYAQGAPVAVTTGRMIYTANGQRIAPAYRVTSTGVVQVILNGKLVNIPVASLSEADGKIMTSKSKRELASAN